jgi:hypothetical protein
VSECRLNIKIAVYHIGTRQFTCESSGVCACVCHYLPSCVLNYMCIDCSIHHQSRLPKRRSTNGDVNWNLILNSIHRSAITIFPQRVVDRPDFRIWNAQVRQRRFAENFSFTFRPIFSVDFLCWLCESRWDNHWWPAERRNNRCSCPHNAKSFRTQGFSHEYLNLVNRSVCGWDGRVHGESLTSCH